jgi:hypothetical protein
MIVYGDPSFEAPIGALVEGLRSRLGVSPSATSLDEARLLLVQAGQLEQAAADGGLGEATVGQCEKLTDSAADLFLARWMPIQNAVGPAAPEADAACSALAAKLDRFRSDDILVDVKLPEGFAFYALFPESYAVATLKWLADRAPRDPILVIGIRSIGTSLSALVARLLRAAGHEAHRITVRPGGHPFARQVELPPGARGRARWALVVDEGPGLSGSSMASVAEAAVRAGFTRDRIIFLPGHGGDPGSQSSPDVRAWWSGTARYVTPTEDLRWDGRTLEEVLARHTAPEEEIETIEELTGGGWRRAAFSDPSEWPAVAAPFERRKIRVTRRDGASFLWSYVGLATPPGDAPERILAARASGGWTPPPTGMALGFLASPWIEGRRLTRADATPEVLAHIGRTIRAFAGPALSPAEALASHRRLADMLYWNSAEALGEEQALDFRPASAGAGTASKTYGDGRLSPHEWIRARDGRILKVDSLGHAWDHTVVGQQPIEWDVAGAMVEWDLDEEAATPLLEGSDLAATDALGFYRMAYAAFRLGICRMCAEMSSDPQEVERLRQAADLYRAALVKAIPS